MLFRATADSADMRNKVFSLELLLSIVENAGPILRTHSEFIEGAIKKKLCMSLLTNGVSPVPGVFRLSLDIFLALLNNFKEYLKTELGVLFTKVYLRILASTNSTMKQKIMVLQSFLKVCNNPQHLVDLFVNYDCYVEEPDIFER